MSLPSTRLETMRGVIPVMQRQLAALERLIEDLVDLTRVQTGKMSILYEHAILQQVLGQAIEGCRDRAGKLDVALHQGTIEVRSEGIGKGAEFVVRLPPRKPRGGAEAEL